MYKTFAFIITLFVCTYSYSQNTDKSSKLLDEVSQKMSSYENFQINFKYILRNLEVNLEQESQGSAAIQGEKYNLDFMGNTFLFDGQKTYVIIPEDEEINIMSDTNDEEMLSPSKILFFYKKGFNYEWKNSTHEAGKNLQYIELTPIDSESEASHYLLGIDTDTKNIYKITEVGNNSTETTFVITDFKANQAISENLFTFDRSKFEALNYTINE